MYKFYDPILSSLEGTEWSLRGNVKYSALPAAVYLVGIKHINFWDLQGYQKINVGLGILLLKENLPTKK